MQLLRSLIAVDESLGKVIETLEKIGELDNTVIIYSSDNGYFMGEHTFKDKRLAYVGQKLDALDILHYLTLRSSQRLSSL